MYLVSSNLTFVAFAVVVQWCLDWRALQLRSFSKLWAVIIFMLCVVSQIFHTSEVRICCWLSQVGEKKGLVQLCTVIIVLTDNFFVLQLFTHAYKKKIGIGTRLPTSVAQRFLSSYFAVHNAFQWATGLDSWQATVTLALFYYEAMLFKTCRMRFGIALLK